MKAPEHVLCLVLQVAADCIPCIGPCLGDMQLGPIGKRVSATVSGLGVMELWGMIEGLLWELRVKGIGLKGVRAHLGVPSSSGFGLGCMVPCQCLAQYRR